MPSFKQRSYQKELLDSDDIPFEDIKRNMFELDLINRYLGGHKITLKGTEELLNKHYSGETVRIAEIGCGGGDNLRSVKKWAVRKRKNISLTGIDINPECILYASSQPLNAGTRFICSDYKKAVFDQKPHVVFASLFCHHFTDEELICMLQWMKEHSILGFFINDLHRHPVAYHSIKILTGAFSKSRLVKNDAPLSVQRGFVKKDWQRLFVGAGINNFQCRWKWAYRWLVTCVNE